MYGLEMSTLFAGPPPRYQIKPSLPMPKATIPAAKTVPLGKGSAKSGRGRSGKNKWPTTNSNNATLRRSVTMRPCHISKCCLLLRAWFITSLNDISNRSWWSGTTHYSFSNSHSKTYNVYNTVPCWRRINTSCTRTKTIYVFHIFYWVRKLWFHLTFIILGTLVCTLPGLGSSLDDHLSILVQLRLDNNHLYGNKSFHDYYKDGVILSK